MKEGEEKDKASEKAEMQKSMESTSDLVNLERLAEELNSEISLLSLAMPPDYDWKLLTLVQRTSKTVTDDLLKLVAKNCPEWFDNMFSDVYQQLETRMHLAIQVAQDNIRHKGTDLELYRLSENDLAKLKQSRESIEKLESTSPGEQCVTTLAATLEHLHQLLLKPLMTQTSQTNDVIE